MADEDISPLNLLRDELQNDDTEIRINSMRKIKIVAQAIGPERTRTELLPFLNKSIDDEDEILVTLSEELGQFVPLVGGANYAACLLEPLEALAAVEETVVRDKAVVSINIIIESSLTSASETMVPLVRRLAEGDWFTSRVSACSLFSVAYTKIAEPPLKLEMREMFAKLCTDETPMVRRAAAANLGKFSINLENEHILSMIVPLFTSLAGDDQDSVRLLAIENCSQVGALLSESENRDHVLPLVMTSIEDRSWRVRFSIAKEFSPISTALGKTITSETLLPLFVTLLQDGEAEVRAAAAKNISSYVDIVGVSEFMTHVLEPIYQLSTDAAPNVRGACSIAVMELAPKIGEALTLQHLFPLYLGFLQDELVDVRLNILKRLGLIAEWISEGQDTVNVALIPAIVELSKDLQWRVRDAVLTTFPALASTLGQTFFKTHFLSILLSGFSDKVGQVRYAATGVLSALLTATGSDFIVMHVVPKMKDIYDTSVIYQERVNVMHAVKQLSVKGSSPGLVTEMTTFALRGARDPVPNVRLVAALTLQELIKVADETLMSTQIRPCLTELKKDQDSDVSYYATVALS